MISRSRVSSLLAIVLCSARALAQFDNQWVEYAPAVDRILEANGDSATDVVTDELEKDFAWGDFDNDGWVDLVIARKPPFEATGGARNTLLMNEGGWLVDRTLSHASASDVAGDFGFLTVTNDRDAVVVDVDCDGWLDVVTACSFSDGKPKHISHPRVYRNLGADTDGEWLGLQYEDARIPLLGTVAPHFQGVAAGDVTGDGAPDLYFTDSGALEDKLLINDGQGSFQDSGTTRMSAAMLQSYYGISATIVDLNLDGHADIVDCENNRVRAFYNDRANVGHFVLSQQVGGGLTYHASVGDLNRDSRPDIVEVSDYSDGYRYNLFTSFDGVVVGPYRTYQFLTGGESESGGNIVIADLDGDGWNDTIHADVDVQVPACNRHAHIYHNPGGLVGAQIVLREEAEMPVGGWRGAKGLLPSDVTGTYDVAVFDLDRDGDLDLVFGRCSGTFVWLNQREECALAHYAYGTALANSTGEPAAIASNGSSSLSANQLVLSARGAPPLVDGLFFYGTSRLWSPVPFGNGNRWIGGALTRLSVVTVDASGNASYSADFGTAPLSGLVAGDVRDFQFLYRDPVAGGAGTNVSDALEIVFCP